MGDLFRPHLATASGGPAGGSDSSAEHEQLDFWLGHWDCRWEGGNGTNRIEKILDGRVIHEQFDGRPSMALQGRSYSLYDTQIGRWRQTWVDNEGGYFDLVGGKDADRFNLQLVRLSDATPIKRMLFQNIAKDGLDWHWQISADGGTTWQDSWYIRYRRLAE